MKTYQVKPKSSIEEYLSLDNMAIDYVGEACKAPEILSAWIKNQEKDTMPHDSSYWAHVVQYYGAMFLFECGRMYGIRQERARKKSQ